MKSMHLEWPFFKWMRPVLEIGVGFTLFIGFVYLVRARDFRSAASVLASVLTIYVAIAALFLIAHADSPAAQARFDLFTRQSGQLKALPSRLSVLLQES